MVTVVVIIILVELFHPIHGWYESTPPNTHNNTKNIGTIYSIVQTIV